jgi:hypothetical protein
MSYDVVVLGAGGESPRSPPSLYLAQSGSYQGWQIACTLRETGKIIQLLSGSLACHERARWSLFHPVRILWLRPTAYRSRSHIYQDETSQPGHNRDLDDSGIFSCSSVFITISALPSAFPLYPARLCWFMRQPHWCRYQNPFRFRFRYSV